jgi:hypothetical protein
LRYEFAEDEWIAIRPWLPTKPHGVPRVDNRCILNVMVWVHLTEKCSSGCRQVLLCHLDGMQRRRDNDFAGVEIDGVLAFELTEATAVCRQERHFIQSSP